MSIIDKIESITMSRNTIRTKMLAAGQATRTDKLANLASNLSIPNTSDATAAASDIAQGKTAYVQGEKITGTSTKDADTSDATATANDILTGKTAYAGGVKLTGTATAGIDTSDATATANDILSGKTAYVDGTKVNGSITSKAAQTYTPGTTDQTIASGQYLAGTQTIAGDADLVASNIKKDVSIFGVTGNYQGSDTSSEIVMLMPALISYVYGGDIVLYNNKIHLLGGGNDNTPSLSNRHFESDGLNWEKLSNINGYFGKNARAVVFNDEIHIMGSQSYSGLTDANYYKQYHCKWDGASWSKVSTLPTYASIKPVVYNNELHLFVYTGVTSYGINQGKHYKLNGTSWTELSTPPIGARDATVVYNNEIHTIVRDSNQHISVHYKWNGTSWTKLSTPPMEILEESTAVVFNGNLYVFTAFEEGSTSTFNPKAVYRYDGIAWTKLSDSLFVTYRSIPIVYNNKLHLFGGGNEGMLSHVIFDGEEWKNTYDAYK